MAAPADVSVSFGAEISGLQKGAVEAKAAVNQLSPQASGLTQQWAFFGQVTTKELNGMKGLARAAGQSLGFALSPLVGMGVEAVKLADNFAHLGSAATALRFIGVAAVGVGAALAVVAIAGKTVIDMFGGPTAEKVAGKLQTMSDTIKQIGDRWEVAGRAAETALRQTDEALKSTLIREIRSAEVMLESMSGMIAGVRGKIFEMQNILMRRGADPGLVKQWRDLMTAPFEKLPEIARAFDELTVGADAATLKVINDFHGMADGALKVIANLKAMKAEVAAVAAATSGTAVAKPFAFTQWDQDSVKDDLKSDLKSLIQAAADALNTVTDPVKYVNESVAGVRKSITGLKTELATMNLPVAQAEAYRKEQELIADAVAQNIQLTPAQRTAIRGVAQEYGMAADQLRRMNEQQQGFEQLAHSIVGAFSAWMSGTDSLTHALLLMTLQIAQAIVEALIFKAVMTALGMPAGGFGGGLGGFIAGALFGGGRAAGGPIEQGKWYIAGEKGPEPVWGGGPGAFAAPFQQLMSGGGGGDMGGFMDRFIKMMFPQFRRMAGASQRMANNAQRALSRFGTGGF